MPARGRACGWGRGASCGAGCGRLLCVGGSLCLGRCARRVMSGCARCPGPGARCSACVGRSSGPGSSLGDVLPTGGEGGPPQALVTLAKESVATLGPGGGRVLPCALAGSVCMMGMWWHCLVMLHGCSVLPTGLAQPSSGCLCLMQVLWASLPVAGEAPVHAGYTLCARAGGHSNRRGTSEQDGRTGSGCQGGGTKRGRSGAAGEQRDLHGP